MISIVTEQELTPRQSDLWLKGCQSVETKNYPYAISLLKALVKDAPGFLEGRKVLRACEIKQNPETKKKTMFGGMRLTTLKKAADAVLTSVEDDLENDPFSLQANEMLYNAAMELGLTDLASFALETICQGHSTNKKYLHLLANHYIKNEQFAEAADAYRRVLQVDPNDTVAIKGEKDCTARASMRSQNWENAKDFRSVMKNAAETADLDNADKLGLTRAELEQRLARLSERYAADQSNLAIVRDIASVYEQMEDWANAYSFYSYAFSLSANDVSIQVKALEMRENMLNSELVALEKAAGANPDNAELQAQLAEKRRERAVEQVTDCKARVEGNPTDPQLRFNLGQALFYAGEFSDAIPELQRARNNPYLRIRAMLMLGKCYEAKNMYDLALRQLEEANAELFNMDDTKKEILYLMGTLHEHLGQKDKALDSFKVIYDADYGYRDVAHRVESAYA